MTTLINRNVTLVMVLAAALAGCGKKDESGAAKGGGDTAKAADPALPAAVAGGCFYADTGVCTFNKESDPKMCESMSGKFAAGECPKQDAVPGTCTCKTEYNTEIKTYYTTSAAKYTADTAKQACVNQQCEWTP
jgi:hypothetical protein